MRTFVYVLLIMFTMLNQDEMEIALGKLFPRSQSKPRGGERR
jgi:hypothetical protein